MPKSSKSKQKNATDEDGNIYDDRFSAAQSRPAFQKRHTGKKQSDAGAVSGDLLSGAINTDQIDDRFKAVMTDPRFAIGGDIGTADGGIDKYGRKLKKKSKTNDKTKEVDDSETSDTGSEKSDDDDEIRSLSDTNDGAEEENDDPESRIAYLKALSRGEVDVSSSSDDDSDGEDESDDESSDSDDSIYGKAGVFDPSTKQDRDIELTTEESRFLAICNMEWSSVRAVDLFTIVSSFVPPGTLKYVQVYESDFGKEQMERDRTMGPQNVWKKKTTHQKESDNEGDDSSKSSDSSVDDDNDDDNDDDEDMDNEKMHTEDTEKEDLKKNDNSSDDLSSQDDEENILNEYQDFNLDNGDDAIENDFDPEKLRAYEASKLMYYFAVAEFTSAEAADTAYAELDGMEVGHSSAQMDLSAIPEENVAGVIDDRHLRDQASSIPSAYSPPDFVVNALQKTDVKCTWEEGDKERERMLTQYGVNSGAWSAMTEGDDLRAYLASDASSDEDSDDEKANKAKNMRKMLGLGDCDDDVFDGEAKESDDRQDDDSFFGGDGQDSLSQSDDSGDEEGGMQMTFIPGKKSLEDKIRNKLKEKENGTKELTPFEKYQLKRKEKRKERKRLAKRDEDLMRGKEILDDDDGDDDDDDKMQKQGKGTGKNPSSVEELDLLLAGDNGKNVSSCYSKSYLCINSNCLLFVEEEDAKDFHMRDIVRIEKNKNKKLRGSRKRKEEQIAANTSGQDFHIDTTDSRFAAVLEGTDDRFGIDKTDPAFKETPAMRAILEQQTKRRKKKKRQVVAHEVTDIDADKMDSTQIESSGALALSSLVKSLKSKVKQGTN